MRRALPSVLHAASAKARALAKPAYSLAKALRTVQTIHSSTMLRCSTTLACLACLTTALQHSPRRRCARTVRRSNDEELSIDELERRERALSDDDGISSHAIHPSAVECARYRWTQDNNFVRVEVPLPRRPSETDVALVVGETSFDLSVVNADLVIRGQLSGEANPGRCGWDLFEEGDGLIVRVAKRGNEDWDTFLVDEVPAPTASYRGVCEATGASYEQTSTEMRIEVALPDHVEARDVNVAVAGGAWAVNAGAWSLGGALMGAVRADDTAWLVDDGVVFMTLTKRAAGTWWPGLTTR